MKITFYLTLALLALCTLGVAAPIDCTLAAPTGAEGTNVTALTSGCFEGGLLFSNFSVNSAPAGTTIWVSAVGTGVTSAGANLGFQITTPAPPVDTMLQYEVSSLTGAAIITGVDNSQNGVDTTIGETVCSTAFVNGICNTANILANFSNPPIGNGTVASFAPQSTIYILKDIAEPTSNSFISSFVNSQETSTAPEPVSSVLLGSGLVGFALLRRKRA